MKKTFLLLVFIIASASASFAQQLITIDVIIGNRPPAPREVNLMQIEEAKHPDIAKSMHDLEDAMKHLHETPDNFGGNKAQAEGDLKQAWISLRKALYYSIFNGN